MSYIERNISPILKDRVQKSKCTLVVGARPVSYTHLDVYKRQVVGGSPIDSIQYELIDKQFDCMAKYLSWDMLFNKSYYATARDELEKNKDSMNELEWIGKNL